jgi:hypothetical protein
LGQGLHHLEAGIAAHNNCRNDVKRKAQAEKLRG